MIFKDEEVYIGKKPFSVYQGVILRKILRGQKSILIKSRGLNIFKAINVALLVIRTTTLKDYLVKIMENETELNGKKRYVTECEITLKEKSK